MADRTVRVVLTASVDAFKAAMEKAKAEAGDSSEQVEVGR